MISEDSKETKFIYWEKQGKDRLWGLHAINSLVQNPLYDEADLGTIAYELDQLEKSILEGAGVPINAIEGTNNVADDGNYNVQVLTKALHNWGEFEIDSIDKPGIMGTSNSFTEEQGFLWNSADHWFAIRKIHDTWFNMNSTNIEPGPQIISNFYLDAFLVAVKNSGYTIFVIRGNDLPLPNREMYQENLRDNQFYIGFDYLKIYYENNKHRQLNTDGVQEDDLEKAIKASLEDVGGSYDFPQHLINDQENYNNDLRNLLNSQNPSRSQNDDDELAQAIALSLQGQNNQDNSGN